MLKVRQINKITINLNTSNVEHILSWYLFSDRKAYIRKMREKMANEIQAKSVTIPLAELQSERESISLAHSRPKTPEPSAIFTTKLGSIVEAATSVKILYCLH